jgi:hypothetical protein
LGFGLAACGADPRVVVGRTSHFTADAQTSAGPDAQLNVEPDAQSAMDADTDVTPDCQPPAALHRYSFDGTGSEVVDSIGTSSGEVRGGSELTGNGRLSLEGATDYVHLPAGILTNLTSVSVMLWVVYDGGPAYVRMFDFGMTSAGEDPMEGTASVGRSYLALSPETGFDPPGLAATISDDGPGGEVAVATDRLIEDGEPHQVVVVFDGATQTLLLYLDGVRLGAEAVPFPLSAVDATNNWLGRSQYDADPYWHGGYDEVRVYAQALSDCQVAASWDTGPNAP